MEKKEYLWKIATRIVDGYVIRRENVENIFNNLLAAEAAEEEEVRQQTDCGRYICFFPGCGKTFASRGKRMHDHEASHNQQVPTQDSQGLLFPSDSAPSDKIPEKDDMFNYQCSLLEYGMLILNFLMPLKRVMVNVLSDAGSFHYLTLEMTQEVQSMPLKLWGWFFKFMHCFHQNMLMNLFGTELHSLSQVWDITFPLIFVLNFSMDYWKKSGGSWVRMPQITGL